MLSELRMIQANGTILILGVFLLIRCFAQAERYVFDPTSDVVILSAIFWWVWPTWTASWEFQRIFGCDITPLLKNQADNFRKRQPLKAALAQVVHACKFQRHIFLSASDSFEGLLI